MNDREQTKKKKKKQRTKIQKTLLKLEQKNETGWMDNSIHHLSLPTYVVL
jgi:hypothetical protein